MTDDDLKYDENLKYVYNLKQELRKNLVTLEDETPSQKATRIFKEDEEINKMINTIIGAKNLANNIIRRKKAISFLTKEQAELRFGHSNLSKFIFCCYKCIDKIYKTEEEYQDICRLLKSLYLNITEKDSKKHIWIHDLARQIGVFDY